MGVRVSKRDHSDCAKRRRLRGNSQHPEHGGRRLGSQVVRPSRGVRKAVSVERVNGTVRVVARKSGGSSQEERTNSQLPSGWSRKMAVPARRHETSEYGATWR